ncbi:hypothetical protein TI39_contig4257g00002 [Zymoseptoria brevis]|uniref:Uncharacterized protein n=1 Tax=Zymoseptoria brevis TaxID=1047168 RepID=A0A0F4G8X8_9PEZI|nr:hypothetical protein TI39_contig4257g00002 [Zymoseptoria brevis]
MLPKYDATVQTPLVNPDPADFEVDNHDKTPSRSSLSRPAYFGTLVFNLAGFLLPALYSTLAKLWVANIDSSMVVTTDVYTYIGVITEVLNEGLPRAAWNIIGDKSNRTLSARHGLSYTLILVQSVLGCIMSIAFVAAAQEFATAFVPVEVREASVTYVKISAFSALSSAIETAVASATRALDQPDVPLIISSVKFAVNIMLDMIVISKFHVPGITPTVNTQAATQLACGLVASFAGLAYFIWTTKRKLRIGSHSSETSSVLPSFKALFILARPGFFTFTESAIRNALYLWLVSGVVALGSTYATAWGVFNTIQWGLVMVPVQALEATSLVFVAHAWGSWRAVNSTSDRPRATKKDLLKIVRPALTSSTIALVVEVPICLFFSFYAARRFALFISADEEVAAITEHMWKTIDWCYICYAVSTQLATVLLATRPRWYLYRSLASNLFWVLPWAVLVTRKDLDEGSAWKWHSIIFGGSLLFSLGTKYGNYRHWALAIENEDTDVTLIYEAVGSHGTFGGNVVQAVPENSGHFLESIYLGEFLDRDLPEFKKAVEAREVDNETTG